MQTNKLIIKGTAYYKANELFRTGKLHKGLALRLRHEENNKYDKNAVAVKVKATGEKLGHLSRRIAPKYAQLLDEGTKFEVIIASIDSDSNDSLKVLIKVTYDASDFQSSTRQTTNKRVAELPRCAGVYAITNAKNSKTYIGSSSNINKRVKAHFSQLRHNIHPNKAMQSEYNREGDETFNSKVIKGFNTRIEQEHLEQLEGQVIKEHIKNGYFLFNMTLDGKGQSPSKTSTDFIPDTVTERHSHFSNVPNDKLPKRLQRDEDIYNTIIQRKIENAINFIYEYSAPISEKFEAARKQQSFFSKLFKGVYELEQEAGAIATKTMTKRQMELCLEMKDEIQFLNSHIDRIERFKSFSFIKKEKLKFDNIYGVFKTAPTNNIVDKGVNGKIWYPTSLLRGAVNQIINKRLI